MFQHGGNLAAYVVKAGQDEEVKFAPGERVRVYVDRQGETEVTEITDVNGDPIVELRVSDGTDGWQLGAIPIFYVPYDRVWLGVNGQPRVMSITNDVPMLADNAAQIARDAVDAAQAAAAQAAALAESSSIRGHESQADPHIQYLNHQRGDTRYRRLRFTTTPLDTPIEIIEFTSTPGATAADIYQIFVTHEGVTRLVRWDNERGYYRAEQVSGALWDNLITLVTAHNGTGRAIMVQQRGTDGIRRNIGGIDARGRLVISEQEWAPITQVDPDNTGRYTASTALGPAPLAVRWDADDVVRAQGRIDATSITTGDTIATVPAGYQPLSSRLLLLPTTSGEVVPVEIGATGRIVAKTTVSSPVTLSLDDLTWARVVAPQPSGDWEITTAAWAEPTTSSPLSVSYEGGTGPLYALVLASAAATTEFTAVSDNGGNTWTRQAYAPQSGAVGRRIELWTCQPNSAFSTITVTFDSAPHAYATLLEITGHNAANPVDQVAADFRSSTTSPQPVQVTPSMGGTLAVAAVMANPNTAAQITPSAGWLSLPSHTSGPIIVYQVDPPSGVPLGVSWTFASAAGSGHVIATFTPDPGGN